MYKKFIRVINSKFKYVDNYSIKLHFCLEPGFRRFLDFADFKAIFCGRIKQSLKLFMHIEGEYKYQEITRKIIGAGIEIGLLINFGSKSLEFRRLINSKVI